MSAPKILPLKGAASLRALQACNALLLGYKMLPAHITETWEEFFLSFKKMPEQEKEKIIRHAAMFVKVEDEELSAILSFASDPNGIPYSVASLKNLGPDEMIEIIVAVCMEISRFKIDLITEEEKKN